MKGKKVIAFILAIVLLFSKTLPTFAEGKQQENDYNMVMLCEIFRVPFEDIIVREDAMSSVILQILVKFVRRLRRIH